MHECRYRVKCPLAHAPSRVACARASRAYANTETRNGWNTHDRIADRKGECRLGQEAGSALHRAGRAGPKQPLCVCVCVCVIRATFPCLGPEERARFLCSGPCLAEGTASLNHREALQPPDARGRRTRLKNKQIFIMYLMQNLHQLSLPHTQAHPVVK